MPSQLAFYGLKIASPAGQSLLSVDHLQLIDGLYALTGENGSGKSTLLRAIMGLHPIKAGTIKLDDADVRLDRRTFLQKSMYQPQNFTAYPELTAFEFLVYFRRLRGVGKRASKADARYWLGMMGLEVEADRRLSTFSQGMLQRLGLAFIFQNASASLCLLDEPFAGVDPSARQRHIRILAEHATDRVVILCTHHVDEAVDVGAHILRLDAQTLTLR